jgi:putative phage-type endonuclease
MITEEQRKQRINYLGSSDAAGVVGASPYNSPLKVWAIKTGQLEEEDISQKLKVKVGTKIEAVIAELYEEQTGKKVRRVNETIYHPQYSFLAANIDRRIVGENTILEIKSTGSFMKAKWEDDQIPGDTMIQVYHQLMVTGMAKAEICALIGNGDDLIIKIIERDEKILKQLEEREVDFWKNYVQKNVMPKLITKTDDETLNRLFPQAQPGKEILLPAEADKIIENLKAFKEDKRNLEGLIDQSENELKAMIKENEIGLTPINQVLWKNSQRRGLDGDSLKKDLPDIHEKYYLSKPVRRFSYGKLGEK